MPRRLLRDRKIVSDDWLYAAECPSASQPLGGDAGHPVLETPISVILSFAQWLDERDAWAARAARMGVELLPEQSADLVASDLGSLALIACRFSGPSEGRGYTQGRLLRERYGFAGELRASGYVRIDQLFFLARCGFNGFELAEEDLNGANAAFSTFTAAYQTANDRGLPEKLHPP